MAMKFLVRLELATQQVRPALQPIITLKMVHLTLVCGHSPSSPIRFTYYGMLLVRLGDIREGYRYVKLAKKLLEKVESKEAAGEVICFGTQVMCFVDPLQATVKLHEEGYAAAMVQGDMNNAMLNKMLHDTTSFWAGIKLHLIQEMIEKSRSQMEQNSHLSSLIHLVPMQRTVLTLVTGEEDEVNRTTAAQGEEDAREKNPHAAMLLHFHSFSRSFMFRQYEQTKAVAAQYFINDATPWMLLYPSAAQRLIGGLVCFWLYRKTNDPG